MDLKEYIASGIIELYASGSLSENESAEVENMIRNNPEIRDEYDKIQKAVYLSASISSKEPSENAKSSLMNKINKTENLKSGVVNHSFEYVSYPKQTNTFKYLMAASISFLLISLVSNFFLWNKLKEVKTELAILNDEKKIITQEYEAVNRKLTQSSLDMKIMSDKNFKMVELNGLEKSPSSKSVAFWNPESKKLFIKVENLPVPPSDMQYQLWALDNGVPVDAGMMDVDPSDKSLHPMKSIDGAQAFAITLEPKGGSKNPTMSEMYAMGKV